MQQLGLKGSGYYETADGTLKWWLRQDGLLDYYKKVNEWYRKGYPVSYTHLDVYKRQM